MNLKNRKVAVIGMGVSGKAAERFLLKRGAEVFPVDGIEFQKNPVLSSVDLIVVSPGVPWRGGTLPVEIIGEVELACRFSQQPMIGITGTNGKTTVTLMITHILNQVGKPAQAVGNVGVPLTQAVDEAVAGEILVTELSSYQLETLQAKVFDAAVILNITPDHLERYSSFEEYAAIKIHLGDCLKSDAVFAVQKEVSHRYVSGSDLKTFGVAPADYMTDGEHLIVDEKVATILPVNYRGGYDYNIENMLAAYCLCREWGLSDEQFFEGLATFKKPPHRLEFVQEVAGVKYYDDSKGTNVDAVVHAVKAMPGKVLLIAGGQDKGSSYQPWVKNFGDKVRKIFAIGEAAPTITQELEKIVEVVPCEGLEEAVAASTSEANKGDCVLLSPGCASFDMFRDYKQRGEIFKQLVLGEK